MRSLKVKLLCTSKIRAVPQICHKAAISTYCEKVDVLRATFRSALPSLLVTLVCLAHAPARAEDSVACVRCSGPDQTYACRVMSDDSVSPEAARMFCMAQIAREHVHDSCAVVRKNSACSGLDVSYVYQDGVGDRAGSAEAIDPEPKQEPGTLADMTRSTVAASAKAGQAVGDATVKAGKAVGEATMKAGQAVGDATKRTLKCLGSALNAC
jgi:hypothetical protein